MKKLLIYALVAVLSFSLFTACTDEKAEFSKDVASAMLDAVKNYQPGTAGAGLKLCIASFAVLDYAEENGAPAELSVFAEEYYEALTGDEKALFSENLSEIEAFCEDVFEKGMPELEPLLNDAGNPNRHEEYEKEKYEAVMTLIRDAAK